MALPETISFFRISQFRETKKDSDCPSSPLHVRPHVGSCPVSRLALWARYQFLVQITVEEGDKWGRRYHMIQIIAPT